MPGSKVSALTNAGPLAGADLLYLAQDIGGGLFFEHKLQVSVLDSRYALQSGTLAQFAATTSAQLAGIISDEVGTGALVFKSYVDTTFSGGVTSFNTRTGAVTFLAADLTSVNGAFTTSPLSQFAATTSAQLAGVISDETGTGALVFATALDAYLPLAGGTMTGAILFSPDDTKNIGNLASLRPANVYAATSFNTRRTNMAAGNEADGFIGSNVNSAAAGSQQYSPALRLAGAGWATTPAASQTTDWRIYARPVQGAANPTNDLVFVSSINGAAFIEKMAFIGSTGLVVNGGNIVSGFSLIAGASNTIGWSGRSSFLTQVDGEIQATNGGGTNFTRLIFGQRSSSFPALARNGTMIEVVAADGTSNANLGVYNTFTSATNFERIDIEWVSNVAKIFTEKGSGGGTARDLVLGADATELMRFAPSSKLSFFGATTIVKQTGGENVTNNVTDTASTNGTIPDITNGTVYATDYTNLRNALFQLARMLKQDHDALRAYGLLT